MKSRMIAVLCLFAIVVAGAWAQDEAEGVETWTGGERWPDESRVTSTEPAPLPVDTYPNALGFSFGVDISPISIFNLHYQRWLGDLGLALNLGAMKGIMFDNASWALDILGSVQLKVDEGNLVRSGDLYASLYVFFQAGYVGIYSSGYNYVAETYAPTWEDYFPLSLGIGFEGVVSKRFSIPVEFGFKYNAGGSTVYFGPTFTTAVRYRF